MGYCLLRRTITFFAIAFLSVGCINDSQNESTSDNQLERFLLNEKVKLFFSIGVDTAYPNFGLWAYAHDSTLDRKFQFPGALYLDNNFIRLGDMISPNIEIEPSEFGGKHILTAVFSNDMKFDWTTNELKSKRKDSINVFFDVIFFEIKERQTITKDSIVLEINKKISFDSVYFEIMAVDKQGNAPSDFKISRVKSFANDGRIAIPLSGFVRDGYKNYYSRVVFKQVYPLMYRGKKKGNMIYSCGVKDIRIKIK